MQIIGLDVGTKRIGVAKADTSVRIAVPVGTIEVDGTEIAQIVKLLKRYKTNWLVLGLPRNLKGEETAQSAYTRQFAEKLTTAAPGAKIRFQDESLTSVEAENRLKSRHKGFAKFAKGEVDAEAASIILQDFIENFSTTSQVEANPSDEPVLDDPKPTSKRGRKSHKLAKIITVALLALAVVVAGAYLWYNRQLTPVSANSACATDSTEADCPIINFVVESGETTAKIAENLESAGLIKNAFAFQLYYRMYYPVRTNSSENTLKVGEYKINPALSTPDIIEQLVKGENESNVFTLTIIPGETVASLKSRLVADYGYSEAEVNAAFAKNYDFDVLKDRHDTSAYGAEPLEGYIFGDTYEFYKGESVENIIKTSLQALQDIVDGNNLEEKFAAQGLTLAQGITLASIVEQEAPSLEQANVAQVFLNRLSQSIPLGSDVTVQYALDLVDPERTTYTNNADALQVDSLYNTRLYAGLTPGPICNPGISALLAVAEPSATDALYFLTGDDGKMYYSSTEEGHNQNIRDHCQDLCNVSL